MEASVDVAVLSAAIGFAQLIALSRVYRLRHHFSDVLAGLLLGALEYAACALLYRSVSSSSRLSDAAPLCSPLCRPLWGWPDRGLNPLPVAPQRRSSLHCATRAPHTVICMRHYKCRIQHPFLYLCHLFKDNHSISRIYHLCHPFRFLLSVHFTKHYLFC